MAPQGVSVKAAPAAGVDPTVDLAPFVPSKSNPWDAKKAAHLMRRAGFGSTPEEREAIAALGPDWTVNILLATDRAPITDRGYVVLSNGERAWVDYLIGSRPQWLNEMVNTRFPLKEKMALFWHDHFSTGPKDRYKELLMVKHVNIFRKLGLGRFRDMLIEVTKDPAMLWFLDNHINGRPVSGRPQINENYGRELLELYTLGVNSGYTQKDVRETSKVLSGWSLVGTSTFAFKSAWHIPGDKVVLGKTIRSNGMNEFFDLIDKVILPYPKCAEFLVGKIWEYFVAPKPYPALLQELARRFRVSGFDIGALMRTILRSNYFYSDKAMRQLVKNPAELIAGVLRNSAAPVNGPTYNYRLMDTAMLRMGYPLMGHGNPSGLADGMAWIDEIALLERANFANDVISGKYAKFDPYREVLRKQLTTAEKIVDHYVEQLLDGDVPSDVRKLLYHFMNTMDHGNTVKFEFTQAKVNEKVRGLLHLVMATAQYQIN